MIVDRAERTPGFKLTLAIVVGLVLTIPLFSVWLLVYDRRSQSQEATQSITAGWGAPQAMSGPLLVIPYRATATETVVENGQSVTRTRDVMRELTLAPEAVDLSTDVRPEVRKRSIYEAVVYAAHVSGKARFAFPPDLARSGVEPGQMQMDRAELRFGVSDPRGLGANPRVLVDGRPLRLQPGGGSGGGRGFFAWINAAALTANPMGVDFSFNVRGNEALGIAPQAGIRAGPWARPGRARASGAISCPSFATSATRASTRPTGSAIWRSAGRWSAPATSEPLPHRRRRHALPTRRLSLPTPARCRPRRSA
jgi:inner membrane protein